MKHADEQACSSHSAFILRKNAHNTVYLKRGKD